MTYRDITQLFTEAHAGDQKAFEKIYSLYAKPLYRYIYLRTGDKEDSEDILQHVFIQIYKQLGIIRIDARGPLPFFFTIARNKVIDHLRAKRQVVSLDAEGAEEAVAVLENHIDRLEGQGVIKLLEQLPPLYREVLSLSFVEELSSKEIAVLLAKQEAHVRQIRSRGIKLLRTLYEKNT